eukprot:1345593-Rhodomonas_salina.1
MPLIPPSSSSASSDGVKKPHLGYTAEVTCPYHATPIMLPVSCYAYHATPIVPPILCNPYHATPIMLRICYAISSTDLGCAATKP